MTYQRNDDSYNDKYQNIINKELAEYYNLTANITSIPNTDDNTMPSTSNVSQKTDFNARASSQTENDLNRLYQEMTFDHTDIDHEYAASAAFYDKQDDTSQPDYSLLDDASVGSYIDNDSDSNAHYCYMVSSNLCSYFDSACNTNDTYDMYTNVTGLSNHNNCTNCNNMKRVKTNKNEQQDKKKDSNLKIRTNKNNPKDTNKNSDRKVHFHNERKQNKSTTCHQTGAAAATNPIYSGPAHSLQHGWLIDSGASCHMSPYKKDLRNVRPCNAKVTVADGTRISAKQEVDVTLLLPTNENRHQAARVKLQRVLLVPGLNRRLFSVTTFTRNPGN